MNPASKSDKLHITIGVHPPKSIDLQQDIKLIKAALLYADKVTIYSPVASMLQIVMELGELSENERLGFLEMVAPYVASSSHDVAKMSDGLRKLRAVRFSKSPSGRRIKAALSSQVDNAWMEIKQIISNMADAAGMGELITALGSGILEIHQFAAQASNSHAMQFLVDCVARASGKQLSREEEAAIRLRNDEMTKEFVRGVCSAVASGSTYPLFDRDTSQLVSLAQQSGYVTITDSSQQRARHIALAGDLLQRLPVFDIAATRDVLVLRGELAKYLVRFRKSVIDFASTVASSPWNDEFEKECELIFRKEVAPTILELEEEIKSQ
jgi:hypothetical protein